MSYFLCGAYPKTNDLTLRTANSDGTLTPELMAVNPESIPSRAKVETITHSLSA